MSLPAPTDSVLVTASSDRGRTHRLFPSSSSAVRFPLSSSTTKAKALCLPARCGTPPPPPPPVDLKKPPPRRPFRLPNPLPFLIVSAGLASAGAFFHRLPADFRERWRHLRETSKGAEAKVTELPYHLIQAIMASEDRRFFYHFGFDPYGLGRAVFRYPNGGGGSTITQQLVKNVFLTNERKISRKFVEGLLSLALERKMSKWEILYAYLYKMYWGHGKFGIESASLFYFGKHPSLLNIGESALLAGILPSPETLNPFTNPARGKSSQARVLRRMVAAGFLDLETALLVVSQPLCLNIDGPGNTNQEYDPGQKQIHRISPNKYIWDWEIASIDWEARETMEDWGAKMHRKDH